MHRVRRRSIRRLLGLSPKAAATPCTATPWGFPFCTAKKQRKRKKKRGGEEKKEKETAASGLVGKRTEATTTVSSLSRGVALHPQRRLGALRHIDAFQEPMSSNAS
jgi:hypothetical protein